MARREDVHVRVDGKLRFVRAVVVDNFLITKIDGLIYIVPGWDDLPEISTPEIEEGKLSVYSYGHRDNRAFLAGSIGFSTEDASAFFRIFAEDYFIPN